MTAPGDGRPHTLVLVAGTATDVGKTWVAAALATRLAAARLAVAARKPAQSFAPDDPGPGRTDAEVLARATGEHPHTVCAAHRWYEVPMAPPMAAAALGRTPPTIADLLAELTWPGGVDVGLVETAGGVRSPIALDGDAVTLADRIGPDLVLVVADAGLGTISAVRSALDAFGARPVLVALNRFDAHDALHAANRAWLVDVDGFDVVAGVDAAAERLVAIAARRAGRRA